MALRIRRGTDAERQTIVPEQGELIAVFDADPAKTNKLYVGDGATEGGVLIGPQSQEDFDLVFDTTPQLGGNLDLNGNNITGTGNIDIDGTITATGAVNLGDNSGGDTLNVGALITSSLRPSTANAYDLGTPNRPWANAYIRDIVAEETIEANNITVKENIVSENSTIIYNGSTDSISVTNVNASEVTADLIGSVFLDDSTTKLVDGQNGTFTTRDGMTISGVEFNAPQDGNVAIDFYAASMNLYMYGLAGDVYSSALHIVNGARGTATDNLQDVQVGDAIGGFVIQAYHDNGYNPKSSLTTEIDAVTGTSNYPAKFTLLAEDYDGNIVPQFEVNSRGVAKPTGAFQEAVYADATARDAGIPTPAAGMTCFVTDVAKFQGYDGSAWVDLN